MKKKFLRVGVFGQTDCGKSSVLKFLVKQLCEREGKIALVLDINRDDWGPHSVVTANFEKFDRVVWNVQGLVVVIDEGTETIDRGHDKTKYFTRIRHQLHHFFYAAHDGTTLLPRQRNQLSEVYQFQCTPEQAELWRNRFADDAMRAAPSLGEYEFLHKKAFQPVRRQHLTLAELRTVE